MSDGTTVRLPKLVGLGRALDLLLTAREVPGPEAVAIGLADRVVDDGRALEEAVALAERMAAFPQTAMLADPSRCTRPSPCRLLRGWCVRQRSPERPGWTRPRGQPDSPGAPGGTER